MEIDKLEISIEASSSKAAEHIDSLRKSLSKLGNLSKKSDLSNLKTQLSKIAGVNLSKISSQLDTLASAVKTLQKTADFKNVFKVDKKTVSNLEKVKETIKNLANTTKDKTPKSALGGLAEGIKRIRENAKQASSDFIEYKKTTEEASKEMSLGAFFMKKFGEEADKSSGKANGFFASLKRIALYRAVRFILKEIAQGFREGFENLAQYSGAANNVMSQLQTTALQLKNSFAAALLPVMQALLPIIQSVSKWLIEVINNLNMLFASMRKQTTYVKAIAYWQDYAKAINKAKGALIGIDELNVLGNNGQNDFTKMFEEANVEELSPGLKIIAGTIEFIKENLAEIATVVGVLIGYRLVTKIGGMITSIGNLWSGMMKLEGNVGALTQSIVGAAGLYLAFTQAKDGTYELARYIAGDNDASLSKAFLSLVTGGAGAVVAGMIIGGPVGAVIGGLAFLMGQMAGFADAQAKMKLDKLKEDFYKGGTAIKDITEALEKYYKSIDIEKNKEWLNSIEKSKKAYEDAAIAFDDLWNTLNDREELSSDDISNLSNAFNGLVQAAKDLNTIKFDSLMSSISNSIKTNITPSLTGSLGSLLDKLYTAKALVDSQLTGISVEYQKLIDEIRVSGGQATPEQRKQLSALREQVTTFTAGPNVDAKKWELSLKNLGKIDAGASADEIKANVEKIKSLYDTYSSSLESKYASDLATLEWAMNIDKTQLGGAIGFTDRDLLLLQASYESQISPVQEQYNAIIKQLYDQYMEKYKGIGGRVFDGLEADGSLDGDVIGNKIAAFFGDSDAQRWLADYEMWKETRPLLNYLEKMMVDVVTPTPVALNPDELLELIGGNTGTTYFDKYVKDIQDAIKKYGYADGGVPSAGLFFANENGAPEYIGQFGNKPVAANNEQIVEGIKRGVAEANYEEKALLREQNELLRALLDKDNSVYVGDDDIGRANVRYTQKRGQVLSRGVFANAY